MKVKDLRRVAGEDQIFEVYDRREKNVPTFYLSKLLTVYDEREIDYLEADDDYTIYIELKE